MADLPMQRAYQNQIKLQLITLFEGLDLENNPLNQSVPIAEHRVGANETLQTISVRLWGVPDYWRALAEANDLSYPYLVYAGLVLKVPSIQNHA